MRRQLVKTITDILERDSRAVLLLGDIGVFGFREVFKRFPTRVYNIGILEQASVGLAAGLATEGMIPIFHTIAPFMVERAFEQLKIDFGYQQLGGNFVSVGASYDYASLGCTHHCPGDVQLLRTIPGMQIVVPGHPAEFDRAFKSLYASGKPTYFRLSEVSNSISHTSGIVKTGRRGVVVAVGPMLDRVLSACESLDVSVVYTTGDADLFDIKLPAERTVVVEPFYEGTLASDIPGALFIGVPRRFLTSYGTREDFDAKYGLTAESIRNRIQEWL